MLIVLLCLQAVVGGKMTQLQIFGGDWTEEKLKRVKEYLSAYTTVLKNQPFRTAYIDAFAGTGYRQLKQIDHPTEYLLPELMEQETQDFLQGSAQIALRTKPRFDKYIFIEQDEARCVELQKLKSDFPKLAPDIMLENMDCNIYLQDLCMNYNWRNNRAVLFLDPFGMQVKWSTTEAVAQTKAIDLWILFPLGVAVNRLLPRDGQINDALRRKLDTIFGTTEWFDAFYRVEKQATLFGEEESLRKAVTIEQIGQYYVERLKSIFSGVADNPLALCNSRNNPLYLLCFASGNPKGAKIAVEIAQHILGK